MIQQFFKKIFEQFLQEKEEEIIEKLCFWVVYYYIAVPKFIVNSSGFLVHINQAHKDYTYNTIEDFLREYSGERRGGFYLEVRVHYIKFEEMIREKCCEMIYAHYFPRFVSCRSLLCKELLREMGISKIEMELGSYETLIFNHCAETKNWIHVYKENVLKKLFVLSLPLIVQAYCENVCEYMKQEEDQKYIQFLGY
ncbi:hypothetical protein [Bacillus sp. NPDC094106]|uniref:hypothetical protein n=1 Tax=Bacillus sp. NPDC094106 TaxID=3363949 RepID=UPI00382E3CDA